MCCLRASVLSLRFAEGQRLWDWMLVYKNQNQIFVSLHLFICFSFFYLFNLFKRLNWFSSLQAKGSSVMVRKQCLTFKKSPRYNLRSYDRLVSKIFLPLFLFLILCFFCIPFFIILLIVLIIILFIFLSYNFFIIIYIFFYFCAMLKNKFYYFFLVFFPYCKYFSYVSSKKCFFKRGNTFS